LIFPQIVFEQESPARTTRESPRKIRVFDPSQVFQERLAGCLVVYLDNNIWIRLREGRSSDAIRCGDLCIAAVESGLAIFPLSHSLVAEMLEIPNRELRLEQADLMDRLSRGTTYRSTVLIHALEAECACDLLLYERRTDVPRSSLCSTPPDHIGDTYVTLPKDFPEVAQQEEFLSTVRTEILPTTARMLIENLERDGDRRQYGNRTAKLSTFYLRPEARKLGLGQHLLFHCLRQWIEKKVERAFVLETERRAMKVAIKRHGRPGPRGGPPFSRRDDVPKHAVTLQDIEGRVVKRTYIAMLSERLSASERLVLFRKLGEANDELVRLEDEMHATDVRLTDQIAASKLRMLRQLTDTPASQREQVLARIAELNPELAAELREQLHDA
jgi:hypothetical protein